MGNNLKLVSTYLVDVWRWRISLPWFWKKIYIPCEFIDKLGIEVNLKELPMTIKLPGKLKVVDGRDYPCKGWICQINNYYKDEAAPHKYLPHSRISASNHRCIPGFDENGLSELRKFIKFKHEKLDLYVARIPSFYRYVKDRYRVIQKTNIVTKAAIIEKTICIDYTEGVGFTEVV